MNTLTRWDPAKELADMQSRLSSLFSLPVVRRADTKEEDMTVADWTPLVDIIEDDKEYLIKAELPEVKKEDVKVTVERGVLNIAGERFSEKEDKDHRYHRVERSFGTFLRSFTIPEDADDTKVNAEFKDGLLKVHLAKHAKALPKSIEVKVT